MALYKFDYYYYYCHYYPVARIWSISPFAVDAQSFLGWPRPLICQDAQVWPCDVNVDSERSWTTDGWLVPINKVNRWFNVNSPRQMAMRSNGWRTQLPQQHSQNNHPPYEENVDRRAPFSSINGYESTMRFTDVDASSQCYRLSDLTTRQPGYDLHRRA